MAQGQELLRVAEVAERLTISRAMVYRLLETKQLRCVSIGVAKRIPASAVDEFIHSHTHGISKGVE